MSMVFWLMRHKCPLHDHDGPEGEQCHHHDEEVEGQEHVVEGVRAAAATFESGEQSQRRKSSIKLEFLDTINIPPPQPLIQRSVVSELLAARKEKKKSKRRDSEVESIDEVYSVETSSIGSDKKHYEEVRSEISIDTGNESLTSDIEECELTTIMESDIEYPYEHDREAVVSDFDVLSFTESCHQDLDEEDMVTETCCDILEAEALELDAEIAFIRSEIKEENSITLPEKEETPPKVQEISSAHVLELPSEAPIETLSEISCDSTFRLKDGEEIQPDKKFQATYKEGVASLTVKDLELEDVGYYTCMASNELGDIKTSADLQVEEIRHRRKKKDTDTSKLQAYRPSQSDIIETEVPPEFVLPLIDQIKKVGEDVEFTVTVRCRPEPEIHWYHGETRLTPTDRVIFKENKGVYRMIVKDLHVTDAGEWRCQANNQFGQTWSSCDLKVLESVPAGCVAPEFTQKLINMTITEGSRARLECMVTGSPTPSIEWYKDRKRIDSDRRCRIRMEEDGFCVMSIQEAMLDDSGAYMCRAINEAGTASTEATIRIQKMAMEPSFGDSDDMVDAPLLKYRYQSPPDFTVQLKNKTVPEGAYVKMSCSVLGIPAPTIRWFKHGEEITKDKHYSFRNNYGLLSLEINQASIQDIGSYTCEATNSEGTVTCNAYLDVECLDEEVTELDFSRPKFLTPLEDVSVNEGEEAVFECVAVGKPMPKFKWQKDMIELCQSSRIELVAERDGTAKLIIKKAKVSDAGLFYCIAYGKSGRCKCSATLRVRAASQSPPPERSQSTKQGDRLQKIWADRLYDSPEQLTQPGKPPVFTLQLQQSVELFVGDRLRLDCSVDGLPAPIVTWHKEYRDLSYDGRHRMVMLGLMHQFEIESVMLNDSGEYIVRATNVFGIIETSCKVTVKPRPEGMERGTTPMVSKPEYGPMRRRADGRTPIAPFFIKHLPRNIDVMEGMNVRLDCILKDGKERITWHIEGAEAEKDKLAKEGFEGDYVPMTDKPPEEPVIKLGKTKDDGKPEQAPYFISKPQDVFLPPGYEAVFECEVGGSPAPIVSWSRAGKPLKHGDSIKLVSKGNKHQIHISSIGKSDAGKYSANISSSAGSDSAYASLEIEVIEKPSPKPSPRLDQRKSKKNLPSAFAKPLEEEVTAVKGDNLDLVCSIEGALKIVWEKDGKKINQNVTSDPDGTQTLSLANLKDRDSGLYACVATFPDNIIIKTRSWVNITDSPTPSVSSAQDIDDGNFKPEFQSELKDITCRDGESVILQCKVKGEPRPQVTWLRDGEELLDGQVYQISTIGDNCQLQIVEVYPEDEGIYSCKAVNSAGQASLSCKLTVEDK
ncbi:hypothetical protein SNE40_022939 [Patella caerulea]|uniref:Ig-like domain-containing protein n=1 Tax=Patella caerulea TaxID=87958 RepID=A0AAN8GBI7_PATCE